MSKPESPLDMLMAKLEQGVQSLFHSEQYEAYLKTMSKFHEYSVNNTILICMQRPDASYVAGYQAWKAGAAGGAWHQDFGSLPVPSYGRTEHTGSPDPAACYRTGGNDPGGV